LLREESGKLNTTDPDHLDTYRIPDLRGQLNTPVVVAETVNSTSQPRLEFDPGHPDADANGYVAYPDINIVQEMVDMITATRAFDANVTVMQAAKEIAKKSLEI
jgi:flagellar basal-body rod protein FlgC